MVSCIKLLNVFTYILSTAKAFLFSELKFLFHPFSRKSWALRNSDHSLFPECFANSHMPAELALFIWIHNIFLVHQGSIFCNLQTWILDYSYVLILFFYFRYHCPRLFSWGCTRLWMWIWRGLLCELAGIKPF